METTLAVTITHDEVQNPVEILATELGSGAQITKDIYVVTITHKYGEDVMVCRTHERARQVVLGFAVDWWEDAMEAEPLPGNADEIINAYFTKTEDYEGYSIAEAAIL